MDEKTKEQEQSASLQSQSSSSQKDVKQSPSSLIAQEIHSQLDNLKAQSRALTEQLLLAENESKMQSEEVKKLRTELTNLNCSLKRTSESLTSYSKKLTESETKRKSQRKAILILCGTILLSFMIKTILVVLNIKFSFALPYILAVLM